MRFPTIAQWLLLPKSCVLCQISFDNGCMLCDACWALLHPITHACDVCCLPLEQSAFNVCGHCIKRPPAFDKVYCHYQLDPVLRTLIHEFKYQRGLYLQTLLASLMLKAKPPLTNTCLIPVPLHPHKFYLRGFNQTMVLAKRLSRITKLPLLMHACSKIKNTKAQTLLTRQARQTNLNKAFSVRSVPFAHIILVDDILTTGSTAHQLALLFKQQGVQFVDVWCIARTSF